MDQDDLDKVEHDKFKIIIFLSFRTLFDTFCEKKIFSPDKIQFFGDQATR